MKRGTKTGIPLTIDIDMAAVESIRFVLEQGPVRHVFDYPSRNTRLEDGVIWLLLDASESYRYKEGTAELDTLVTLKNTSTNPETPVVTINVTKTLFTLKEVEGE